MSERASESSALSESTPDIIRIHDLRPAPGAKTAKRRVGRGEGGKGGKTAGRGTKGTRARKGVPAAFEGGQMPLHMRLPKLKGFRNRFRVEFQVVNVGDLGRLFPDGGTVGPDELVAAGAVRRNKPVKVLGEGELGGVTLTVAAHAFSGSAREKIEAAGGSVEQL
jgi:large subunit ribosomal protein L15